MFVEAGDFVDRESGGGEGEDFDGGAFGFVGENVKGVDVDVAVNEDDFSFGLFNHFDEEGVCVKNLAVKEDFLVGFVAAVFFDDVKKLGEFGVVFALVF